MLMLSWNQVGDWNKVVPDLPATRYAGFKHRSAYAMITQISLFELDERDFKMILKIRPNEYEQFKTRLIAEGVPPQVFYNKHECDISLRAHYSNAAFFYLFLSRACRINEDIELIRLALHNMISTAIQDRIYKIAPFRPSQPSVPAAPNAGSNADALSKTNIDAPAHLCCPLSRQVMTDPVRFAGIDNQDCFEDSWIMDYLQLHQTHPISAESVSRTMLVSDLFVKRECDAFTNEKCKMK